MDLAAIAQTRLLRGLDEGEQKLCLAVLDAREKEYQKGALLIHAGETTERMGLVLSGSVTVEMNDAWGEMLLSGTPEEVFSHRDTLNRIHLGAPFFLQLKQALNDRGIKIPETVKNMQELEDYLCR